jgi:DNA-binding NarL/FixJ family response regulator
MPVKSVLIVEDELALLEAYTLLFKSNKYEVIQAVNGKAAIACIKGKQPDYIILDILMPIMGGIEFLEKMDFPNNYPAVKILVLSNLSDPKTLEKVMSLGASKYLLKASASPRELVEAIETL